MKRVIAVLALVLVSCAQRTKSIDLHTSVNFSLAVAEMEDVGDKIGGVTSPKTAKNSLESENGDGDRSVTDKGVSEKTNPDEKNGVYSDSQGDSASKSTQQPDIKESVFYVFGPAGNFLSRSVFAGGENCHVSLSGSGMHTVYVLCNMSDLVDLPAAPSKNMLDRLTIHHRPHYERLPFAGKTDVEIIPGSAQQIKVKLNRINSAIRLENGSADRIDLKGMVVSGLPSMGYVFDSESEVPNFYEESAESTVDADGNVVVYSFMVPKSRISNVKVEAKAQVKGSGEEVGTVAPLSFVDKLEVGKRATAMVEYLESGSIKIESPDEWGNTGKWSLTDDVSISVIDNEFSSNGELRAFGGGCLFSFIVGLKSGVATLETVGSIDWVHITDNVIVVDKNDTGVERTCRIAVKVDGRQVGLFSIVQGPCITFTGVDDTVVDDGKVTVVGGRSTTAQVRFTVSDAEFERIAIVPVDNGKDGVTVTVDRAAKTLTANFIPLIDASLVDEKGVSVPVDFVDAGGGVQATLTFVQRPARITFNPSDIQMSYDSDISLVVVTTEYDGSWTVNSVKDKDGLALSWLRGVITSGSATGASGGNLSVELQSNDSRSSRTGYVRVESRATISKPLAVVQDAVPDLNHEPGEAFELNGVIWSKYNLANPRQAAGGATFATKLPSECTGIRKESHGKFYQWGINVAWNTFGNSLISVPSGVSWSTLRNPGMMYDWSKFHPCPVGYRVPTKADYEDLIANTNISRNGGFNSTDYGYITMTLKTDASKKLEFPAVGLRNDDSSLSNIGHSAEYWTSDNMSYGQNGHSFSAGMMHEMPYEYGLLLRCVKDNNAYETVNIGGVEWMRYNLANPKQAEGGATFATKLPSECTGIRAESHGKFYQWSINVAWNTIGDSPSGATPSGTWQSSLTSNAKEWSEHPCPDGYRLPTRNDFEKLKANTWIVMGNGWNSSDYGWYSFTDGNSLIEFPAVGGRNNNGSLFATIGKYGNYWCMDRDGGIFEAYVAMMLDNGMRLQSSYVYYGYNVRCVKE